MQEDELTDSDRIRIYDFVMWKADAEIPCPTSESIVINIALEFELKYG